MTFWAGLLRAALLLAVCISLDGCFPAGSGPLDEEKEPHFLAGKSRISTLDYQGAIQCFERALQVNPESASAHFELACLFDEKEVEPASAIYHYEHYLKLRPEAGNADVVKQRILICKQALAQGVSLGPVTEKLQRQFEQLSEDYRRVTEENKRIREDLEKWSRYAGWLQTLTNPASRPSTTAARAAEPAPIAQASTPVLAQVVPVRASGTASGGGGSSKTHTVKAGETPSFIARKYGIRVDALMAANPNLDPRRLRVGQTLRIPGS